MIKGCIDLCLITILIGIPTMWLSLMGIHSPDYNRADESKRSLSTASTIIWLLSVIMIVVSILVLLCLKYIKI